MRHLIFILLVLVSVGAATKKPTTTIAADKCVTGECHVSVKNYKVLHGPVANNACDACHDLTSAREHKYKLLRTKTELCTYCHEFNLKRMPVIHKPIEEGECLGCHDPHGGETQSLTLEKSMTDLCGRCHESITRNMKVLHTPVAKGACNACHSPHASRFPKLLDLVGTDLCLTCHDDISAQLAIAPSRHKALEQGCAKCHNPHGSSHPKSTTQPIVQQCASCHESTITVANQSRSKHSVVMVDRACLTCHNPHAGKAAKLLIDQPIKICMDCHTDNIKNLVKGVPEVLDRKLAKHGPIRDGKCEGCHAAHGSELPMLLTKTYQATNYQHFSEKSVELCFSCHDAKMMQVPTTTKLTAFRNGDRNLHYVHVAQTKNDRNCAICHATHAAANDRLIRDVVQVKKWRMPIAFVRSKTGGSCRPGCHGEYRYDRERPLTTMPTPQPTQLAHARDVTPKTVEFTATDLRGVEVHVPRSDCITILALTTEANCRELFTQLSTALNAQNLQVVIVATSIVTPPSPQWHVIVDADKSLAAQLEVHAWPMVLLLDRDGLELARISDTSAMLRERINSYLHGTERIASATQATTNPASTRVARLIRLAEGLLKQNKADKAMKLLEEALRLQPQSTSINLAMIRTEMQLGHGYEALSILRQVPVNDISPTERTLLEGEIFMTLQKWEDAKRLLTTVAVDKSKSRRFHELLAQIYEHQKDWERAAIEYRAATQATEE